MKTNTSLFLQVLYCKRLTLLGFIFDREARCFKAPHTRCLPPRLAATHSGTPGRRAFDRGIQPPPSPRLTLPPRAASPRALRHRHCPTATRKHPYSPGPSPPGLRDAHSLQHRSHQGHLWPSKAAMQQSLQTTTRWGLLRVSGIAWRRSRTSRTRWSHSQEAVVSCPCRQSRHRPWLDHGHMPSSSRASSAAESGESPRADAGHCLPAALFEPFMSNHLHSLLAKTLNLASRCAPRRSKTASENYGSSHARG